MVVRAQSLELHGQGPGDHNLVEMLRTAQAQVVI